MSKYCTYGAKKTLNSSTSGSPMGHDIIKRFSKKLLTRQGFVYKHNVDNRYQLKMLLILCNLFPCSHRSYRFIEAGTMNPLPRRGYPISTTKAMNHVHRLVILLPLRVRGIILQVLLLAAG
jgi:hypothetical protein